MQLNDTQKRRIIKKAQELYRKGFKTRCKNDPFAQEVDIKTFKEACYEMSCLIHYLAKEMYNVPDEENLIYHCEFKYENSTWSHFFNKICGRNVDSTIMQFKKLSPYENHDDCYTNLELKEYSTVSINFEIELYKAEQNRNNCLYREYKANIGKKNRCFANILKYFKR